MTKEQALVIWESLYGENDIAYDFASHQIKKDDYQDEYTGQGWDVDLIQPLNRGGYMASGNYVIESLTTMAARNGRASFKLGNFSYEVRKGRRYGTYSIFDVTDRNHIVSMDPTEENQEYTYNEARMAKSIERQMDEKQSSFKDPFSFYQRPEFNTTKEEPSVEQETKEQEAIKAPETIEEKEPVAEVNEITEAPEKTTEEKEPEIVLDEDNIEEEKTVDENSDISDDENLEVNEEETSDITEEAPVENKIEETTESENVVVEEEPKTIAEDDVQEKDSDLEELFLQIESLTKENNELKEKEGQLEAKLQEADAMKEKELSDKDSYIAQLQNENESLKKSLEEKSSLEDMEAEKESELGDAKSEIETLKQEKSSLEEKTKTDAEEIDRLNALLLEQEEKVQGFALKEEAWNQEKQEQTENSQRLQDELNGKEEEILLLQNNIQEKENELHVLKEESVSYQRKESEYQNVVSEKESEKSKLKEERDDIMLQFALLEDKDKALKEENVSLQEIIEELRSSIGSHRYETQAQQDQNEALMNTISDLKSQKESWVKSLDEKDAIIQTLEKEKEEISSQLTLALGEKENLKNEAQLDEIEKNSLANENQKNKLELTALRDQRTQVMVENSALKKDMESLNASLLESQKHVLYLSLGGDNEFYDEFVIELGENEATEDNVKALLMKHPNWISEGGSTVLPLPEPLVEEESDIPSDEPEVEEYSTMDLDALSKDQERKNIGCQIFKKLYLDCSEATDFAGRTIRLDAYKDEKSPYAWDFMVLDNDKEIAKENVILGNVESLKNVSLFSMFSTNGHRYQIVEENGTKKLLGLDESTNVYDFNETMNVVSKSVDSKAPLVYIFVKFFNCEAERQPDYYQMQKFINIIEKTVKRVCIHSFISLHTSSNYAFITFDGNVDGVYEEVKKYAILLNSYRFAFQKEKWLNAIIVCSEVLTELSNRFYNFDRIASVTKDKEMGAIVYDLNKTSVVDTMIKRTVHFGPSIVDKMHLKEEYLSPSRLGQGNYSQAYGFDKVFKQTLATFNINYQKKD